MTGLFLLELYRLARESASTDFPTQALALLQRQLAFDSGRWLRSTYRPPGTIQVHEAHLFNDSDEMLKAHENVIEQNAPNWKAVRSAEMGPFGYAYNSAATFASPSTAEIREYQRRYQHENTMNVLVKRRSREQTHYRMIALHRARPAHLFTRREVSQVRGLLPHFLEALAINSVISNTALLTRASPCSAGIAEYDRSIVFAEPGLRDLMQAAWPGSEPGKAPLELWNGLVRDGIYRGRNLIAIGNESHGMMFLRMRRSCAADTLSQRELQVARLDGAGYTYKEISRQMGTAPVTVRNQLQRVHEKLGARNRGEVMASLALLG